MAGTCQEYSFSLNFASCEPLSLFLSIMTSLNILILYSLLSFTESETVQIDPYDIDIKQNICLNTIFLHFFFFFTFSFPVKAYNFLFSPQAKFWQNVVCSVLLDFKFTLLALPWLLNTLL